MNLFVLCAIQSFLLDIIFNSHGSSNLILNQWTVRNIYPLFALNAVQETEDNTRPTPSQLDVFEDASDVENMAAAYLNTGPLVVPF